MLRLSGTVEGELANPARAGRQQRQSVLLCRGSLAYFADGLEWIGWPVLPRPVTSQRMPSEAQTGWRE